MIQLLLLSMDSFLAAFALGALGLNGSRRRGLCLAFGLCDGAASLAGLHLHLAPFAARAEQAIPLAAMACCWMILVAVLTRRITATGRMSAVGLALLPLLLCVDNLFGTPLVQGSVAHSVAVPCLVGTLSGMLAFAGYQAGALIADRIPSRLTIGLSAGLLLLLPALS